LFFKTKNQGLDSTGEGLFAVGNLAREPEEKVRGPSPAIGGYMPSGKTQRDVVSPKKEKRARNTADLDMNEPSMGFGGVA